MNDTSTPDSGRAGTAGPFANLGQTPQINAEPPPQASDVGTLLCATRMRIGKDLQDVAAVLHIRYNFLVAIEDGRYEDLPGQAYAIGFVRAYADHLGLDGDEVVRRYKEETAGIKRVTRYEYPIPPPESGIPSGALLLIAVVLGMVVYGVWYSMADADRRAADVIQEVPERLAALLRDDTAPSPEPEQQVADAAVMEEAPPPPEAEDQPTAETPAPVEVARATAPAPTPAASAPVVTTPVAQAPAVEAPLAQTPPKTPAPTVLANATPPAPAVAKPEPQPAAPVVQTPPPAQSAPTPTVSAPVAQQPVSQQAPPTPAKAPVSTPAPTTTVAPAVAPAVVAPKLPTPAPATPPSASVQTPPVSSAPPASKPEPAKVATATPASPVVTQAPLAQAVVQAPATSSPTKPPVAAPTAPAATTTAAAAPQQTAAVPSPKTTKPAPTSSGRNANVELRAKSDSWIQVRDGEQLLLTRFLRKGESYKVPDRTGLTLMTLNAGGVEIIVDGAVMPPLGDQGSVARGVSLDGDKLKAQPKPAASAPASPRDAPAAAND